MIEMNTNKVERNYKIAKEIYAEFGVDTDKVLTQLNRVPISVHCWQIDDLQGWEFPKAAMTGGIAATGNAPGKARNSEEFMKNLKQALDLIPRHTKLALHAIYMNKHESTSTATRSNRQNLRSGWIMPRSIK